MWWRGEGSNEEKYYLSEDVKIEYYFGGVDGTREQYEYVEICFADPDRLDRGLFTYKRIDDYDSAEYACDKVFSLDGEIANKEVVEEIRKEVARLSIK